MGRNMHKSGFTITEILIGLAVLSIIGYMISISVVQNLTQISKVAKKADIREYFSTMELMLSEEQTCSPVIEDALKGRQVDKNNLENFALSLRRVDQLSAPNAAYMQDNTALDQNWKMESIRFKSYTKMETCNKSSLPDYGKSRYFATIDLQARSSAPKNQSRYGKEIFFWLVENLDGTFDRCGTKLPFCGGGHQVRVTIKEQKPVKVALIVDNSNSTEDIHILLKNNIGKLVEGLQEYNVEITILTTTATYACSGKWPTCHAHTIEYNEVFEHDGVTPKKDVNGKPYTYLSSSAVQGEIMPFVEQFPTGGKIVTNYVPSYGLWLDHQSAARPDHGLSNNIWDTQGRLHAIQASPGNPLNLGYVTHDNIRYLDKASVNKLVYGSQYRFSLDIDNHPTLSSTEENAAELARLKNTIQRLGTDGLTREQGLGALARLLSQENNIKIDYRDASNPSVIQKENVNLDFFNPLDIGVVLVITEEDDHTELSSDPDFKPQLWDKGPLATRTLNFADPTEFLYQVKMRPKKIHRFVTFGGDQFNDGVLNKHWNIMTNQLLKTGPHENGEMSSILTYRNCWNLEQNPKYSECGREAGTAKSMMEIWGNLLSQARVYSWGGRNGAANYLAEQTQDPAGNWIDDVITGYTYVRIDPSRADFSDGRFNYNQIEAFFVTDQSGSCKADGSDPDLAGDGVVDGTKLKTMINEMPDFLPNSQRADKPYKRGSDGTIDWRPYGLQLMHAEDLSTFGGTFSWTDHYQEPHYCTQVNKTTPVVEAPNSAVTLATQMAEKPTAKDRNNDGEVNLLDSMINQMDELFGPEAFFFGALVKTDSSSCAGNVGAKGQKYIDFVQNLKNIGRKAEAMDVCDADNFTSIIEKAGLSVRSIVNYYYPKIVTLKDGESIERITIKRVIEGKTETMIANVGDDLTNPAVHVQIIEGVNGIRHFNFGTNIFGTGLQVGDVIDILIKSN